MLREIGHIPRTVESYCSIADGSLLDELYTIGAGLRGARVATGGPKWTKPMPKEPTVRRLLLIADLDLIAPPATMLRQSRID